MKKYGENKEESKSNIESTDKKNQETLGIGAIKSIVEKAIKYSGTAVSGGNIVGAVDAILKIKELYYSIPEKLRIKAREYVYLLWEKRKLGVSTNLEPKEVYKVSFENAKLNKLMALLPRSDQAIMLQGKVMLDLINKSLHANSEEIKKDVERRYGRRGLNIVDMITTNDITYMLKEIKEPLTAENCGKIFNDWALYYDSIALLVSPSELDDPDEVQRRVIEISKNTVKDYVLLNISGTEKDCDKFKRIISNLKKEKKLKYKNETQKMDDSGFNKSLKIILFFKDEEI